MIVVFDNLYNVYIIISLFQGNETTDEKGTVDMADIVADDVCTRVGGEGVKPHLITCAEY